MKRAMASALTLFCVACGGAGDDAPPAPTAAPSAATEPATAGDGANEPPQFVEIRLEPENASATDAVSLELVVRDPDQDRVRTTVEWYRNGTLMEDETDSSVEAGTF